MAIVNGKTEQWAYGMSVAQWDIAITTSTLVYTSEWQYGVSEKYWDLTGEAPTPTPTPEPEEETVQRHSTISIAMSISTGMM